MLLFDFELPVLIPASVPEPVPVLILALQPVRPAILVVSIAPIVRAAAIFLTFQVLLLWLLVLIYL